MASTALHLPILPLGSRENLPRSPGWRGALASLRAVSARMRQSAIDREAGALIEGAGGKFTDSLDRAIERRLLDRL
jgi:hypothetical protein